MTVNRRQFLGGLAGLGAAVVLGSAAGCSSGVTGQTAVLLPSGARRPPPFRVPLPIPPVKTPVSTDGPADLYEITQKAADVEIVPGLTTRIWGYDGQFPGPTIISRTGRPITVRHVNDLSVPTVVHLHGGHTPASSDGYPIDLNLPKTGGEKFTHHGMLGEVTTGSRDHTYPMNQPAATLWYHDHRMDFTAPQVWRGLAGFHLVHDDVEDALPLPKGDRDIPLMIQDRSFAADGSLAYPSLDPDLVGPHGVAETYMSGVLGDVILVNGAPWPVLEVDAVRYRLRLLNASNARRYGLRLDPAPPSGLSFTQVGSDGGLLAAPVPHDLIQIAAAERFDVVVDFSAYPVGTTVTLRNGFGSDGTDQVMRFRVVRTATDDSSVPSTLAEIEPLVPAAGATVRDWTFRRGGTLEHTGWTINGHPFDPAKMLARPPLDVVEIWRFSTDLHHPVHVHLSPFQVLSRSGGGPGPYDAGWKDTVDVLPLEYVEVAVRFSDYEGAYLIHCHNVEHEDMGMMAAFATVGV